VRITRGSGQKCQETFAWGLRNPFRIAFDPNSAGTRFMINDVGQDTAEEIELGQARADYGWNAREGLCATGSTTEPASSASYTATFAPAEVVFLPLIAERR
jgi:hypothetical protein